MTNEPKTPTQPAGEYPPLHGDPALGLVQYTAMDMRAAIDADRAMRAQPAPAAVAVPDGWKLVPVVPTQEMRAAGYDAYGVEGCYGAMLAAAPLPPAPAAVAVPSEFPHEQMDAMALARYKVVLSDQSMHWRHAVVAGDGKQQLYIGREVECQNMARKFAGAFLDGAFAFHSMTEEMHVAAVKVLLRAPGLDGLPQRMLDAMCAATPQQTAAAQEPGYQSKQLAEMVLSDCGHSSDFAPLLDRVARRIDVHVEQQLSALRVCIEEKQAAPLPPAPAAVAGPSYPSITIDFKMATELLEMFCGEPGLVTLQMGSEKSHSGAGLYAYYSELPEEGAEFLGAEPDDEAAPQPPAAAQGDALPDEDVRELTAIGRAVNRAAIELPQGARIKIELKRDAGTAYWLDDVEIDWRRIEGDGEPFSVQINAAIDAARAQAKEGGAA